MSSVRIKTLLDVKYKKEKITIQRKGSDQLEEFSIKGFTKLFNVDYLHGAVCKKQDIKKLKQCIEELKKTVECENERLKHYLASHQQYFNMVYLNDRCGYALVANRDIPENTIVGVYSGKLILEKSDAFVGDTTYMMKFADKIKIDDKSYDLNICARQYGDLTRFVSHLPKYTDLVKEKFDSSIGQYLSLIHI